MISGRRKASGWPSPAPSIGSKDILIFTPRSLCGSAASRSTSLKGALRKCRSSFPARPIERKISRQRLACSRIKLASSCSSEPSGKASINSALVNFIVAKGVPSSCAAAATTPPKSVSFCSRLNAICVANKAFPIAFISFVTRREYTLKNTNAITIAIQFPKTNNSGMRKNAPAWVRRGK